MIASDSDEILADMDTRTDGSLIGLLALMRAEGAGVGLDPVLYLPVRPPALVEQMGQRVFIDIDLLAGRHHSAGFGSLCFAKHW